MLVDEADGEQSPQTPPGAIHISAADERNPAVDSHPPSNTGRPGEIG